LFPIRDLNPTRVVPVITLAVIALNLGLFFLWQPSDEVAAETFLYERAAIACELTTNEPLTTAERATAVCRDDSSAAAQFPDKNVWLAGLVSMFLHGNLFHILSNMWFLWIFGNNVEEAFGTAGYLAMYVAAGLAATAVFVLSNPDETAPLIGASGAIAGVLGAYLVLFPNHRVLSWVLFFFVPVPAILFLGLWFLSQFGIEDPGIAWQAHAAGFVFGAVLALPLRNRLLHRVATLHQPTRYRF
jgi:membrane associated rhomboid family serine protease